MAPKKGSYLACLSERLRLLRRQRGLGQEQMAEELGVAVRTYASWERGMFAPRFEQLLALADWHEMSLDDLVGRGGTAPARSSAAGISWRLAWSPPPDESDPSVPSRKRLQRGAEIWERLVRGDSLDDVTRELGISGADLEQIVQDLVLSESIVVQKVQRNESLEHAVRQAFVDERGQARLRDVWVADLSSIDLAFVRYVLLGYLAKAHFRREVRPGNSVGLCGGFAVSRMVYALQPGECPGGIRVFPIAVTPVFERATASANSVVSALGYRHFDYGVQASELPFVFEAALEQQPSPPPMRIAKRILDDAAQVDFVFMGIGGRETGALAKDITDFQRDYRWLARLDMDTIKLQGQPVGDIMYHLVDAEGRPLPDFEQQNRELVCSIGLECLRQFVERGKRVVIIAADEDKADVTRAAIVGGYANVLMIDDGLARGLIGRSVRQ